MKKIALSGKRGCGKFALVDDNLYHDLNKRNWYISVNAYATTSIKRVNVYMHRLITNAKKGDIVDHINRDELDNRKENLRIVTQSENTRNSKISKKNKSGHKGVSLQVMKKEDGKKYTYWQAQISIDGRNQTIGLYKDKLEAANAYIEKSKELGLKVGEVIRKEIKK